MYTTLMLSVYILSNEQYLLFVYIYIYILITNIFIAIIVVVVVVVVKIIHMYYMFFRVYFWMFEKI